MDATPSAPDSWRYDYFWTLGLAGIACIITFFTNDLAALIVINAVIYLAAGSSSFLILKENRDDLIRMTLRLFSVLFVFLSFAIALDDSKGMDGLWVMTTPFLLLLLGAPLWMASGAYRKNRESRAATVMLVFLKRAFAGIFLFIIVFATVFFIQIIF